MVFLAAAVGPGGDAAGDVDGQALARTSPELKSLDRHASVLGGRRHDGQGQGIALVAGSVGGGDRQRLADSGRDPHGERAARETLPLVGSTGCRVDDGHPASLLHGPRHPEHECRACDRLGVDPSRIRRRGGGVWSTATVRVAVAVSGATPTAVTVHARGRRRVAAPRRGRLRTAPLRRPRPGRHPARNSTRVTGSLGRAATATCVLTGSPSSGAVIETTRGSLLTITGTGALGRSGVPGDVRRRSAVSRCGPSAEATVLQVVDRSARRQASAAHRPSSRKMRRATPDAYVARARRRATRRRSGPGRSRAKSPSRPPGPGCRRGRWPTRSPGLPPDREPRLRRCAGRRPGRPGARG